MWMMLQQSKTDDYVISTGEAHSVSEFITEAFNRAVIDREKHLVHDKRLLRPMEVDYLKGDVSIALKVLGWKPKATFEQLIAKMVDADLERWRRWQKGEVFPWDALYPNDDNMIISRYALDR